MLFFVLNMVALAAGSVGFITCQVIRSKRLLTDLEEKVYMGSFALVAYGSIFGCVSGLAVFYG